MPTENTLDREEKTMAEWQTVRLGEIVKTTEQVLRIDRRVKHQDFVYISQQDILMQRQVIKQSSV